MSPTVLRYGKFRLFFFSREEEPATGLDQRQLREAQAIIQNHVEEITDAWNRHFRA